MNKLNLRAPHLKVLVTLFMLLVVCSCSARPTTITETQKLESLARVWGFLKYYHPTVASGKLNWDQQLIDKLPKVKAAQTKQELNQVYLEWIGELGDVKAARNRKASKSVMEALLGLKETGTKTFDENFNLSWTNDKTLFTEELIQALDVIEQHRAQGNNHYATVNEYGFLDLKNEEPYSELHFKYPDEAYRLLNLFRYWNIIEYYFPYKYRTDQNWNDVLAEMIPRFLQANDLNEYHLSMVELVTKINDSHASISVALAPTVFGHFWLPARFKIIENKAVITSFYNDSLAAVHDIKIGDVVHRVNGEAISDIIKSKEKYIPASNQSTLRRDMANAVFNGVTDAVTITFERNGIIAEKQVARYMGRDLKFKAKASTDKWKKLEGNIGYVDMGLISVPDVQAMMQELANCKAIIFDVRNYPNGVMFEVAKYLNPEPRDFAKFTIPDLTSPGKFKWVTGQKAGEKNPDAYIGKVVLLVNETTQSHAEFTVMALQTADNATIVGSQTAGADGNVIPFKMIGGHETMFTGIGVFYPDGRETQRIGIVPDIEVKPTIAGIKAGKDEVLEKALEFIMAERSRL